MMQPGFNINDLVREAHTRWLKPVEVLFILQNYENQQLTQEPPRKPSSGNLFLFNKRVLRFFRKDGHNWRKKKDGRTVGEAHERLKVGNAEALNCYYAHGEQNPNFQRRSYWMLDPACEHIVLVHYRDITEGKQNSGIISQLSPGSSFTLSDGSSSHVTKNPGSTSVISDLYDSYHNFSSPSSVEVNSDAFLKNNGVDYVDSINGIGESDGSPELEVSQALRRIEEQLSLNDDSLKEIGPFCVQDENLNEFGVLEYERDGMRDNDYLLGQKAQSQYIMGCTGTQDGSEKNTSQQDAGDDGRHHQQSSEHSDRIESKDSLYWKEMLDLPKSSLAVDCQEKLPITSFTNENPATFSSSGHFREHRNYSWLNYDRNEPENYPTLLDQGAEKQNFSPYCSLLSTQEANLDYYDTNCSSISSEMPFDGNISLTVAQRQKYTIRDISPDWGYATEATKVIIIGSFLCLPSESSWSCLIGDTEVPLQIIQEGVLCFQAPPHVPGKVTLCITSGNRESCSEVREFDYRSKTSSHDHSNLPMSGASEFSELLLVRFVQMLLADPPMQKEDHIGSAIDQFRILQADEDSWTQVIEALLAGSGTSSSTVDWLLQELLKDKLKQWLSHRLGSSLSKKEQGIIHMVAGLGFVWALDPVLRFGVNVNFRDCHGWTALHWAAHFGREKMVAALMASGASAGAVTDPNAQDPTGKTAASIASMGGHKGLAGYLSEVALTSHLESLTLEESELSKGSADLEAEISVNNVSNGSLVASEDQLELKNALAAVRNAAQAAARIQYAFRAHSFRKRQLSEAANVDEYGITPNDIQEISAASKLAFFNLRNHNTAALSIQKKYRGWKGRREFLDLRQKVVKIQAHVRGHQVRKNYRVIWAVGILEKVVLRWRRKGVGLRGFRPESVSGFMNENEDEDEDEDVVKVFRKEKVEVAIAEAYSRVLSMVDSPGARQQYHRVLERFREAKADIGSSDVARGRVNYSGP